LFNFRQSQTAETIAHKTSDVFVGWTLNHSLYRTSEEIIDHT